MNGVRVAGLICPIQPEYVEDQHVRFVFFTFCSGTDKGHDGWCFDCGPTGACNAVSSTKALLQLLVSVGGSSGSRDVIYQFQKTDWWSQEGERGLEENSNCNLRLRAIERKGSL